ncbi:MAG: PDZ domain-containing protein [Chitinophagales bacterium]|nr:PDZ domain-containing protein [Chitinophagales bacterium]
MRVLNCFKFLLAVTIFLVFSSVYAGEPGYLGISIKDFSLDNNGNPVAGVQVVNIFDDGAAKNTALKENDIITHINGLTVHKRETVLAELAKLQWGDEVELVYFREGGYYTIKFNLGYKKITKTYNMSKMKDNGKEIWQFKDDNTLLTLDEAGNAVEISRKTADNTTESIDLTQVGTAELPQYFLDYSDKKQAVDIVKIKQTESGSKANEVVFIKTVKESGTPTQTQQETELNLNNFSISPNPTIDGSFNLGLQSTQKATATIQIFDITGKIVWSKQNVSIEDAYSEKVDLGKNIAKGTYLIQVVQGGKKATKKLLVQ